MTPRQLSHELRTARTPALAKRRAIVSLSLASAGIVGFLALYQFGTVRRLPDVKRGIFDADEVRFHAFVRRENFSRAFLDRPERTRV